MYGRDLHRRPICLSARVLVLALALAMPAAAEIAVIVHPDNPVQAMTSREVSDLYLGRARRFAVDEPRAPLSVYEHPGDSVLRQSFFRALNGMGIKQLNAYWARLRFSGEVLPPVALADSRSVVDAVSRDRGAIGYVDAAAVSRSVKVVLRLPE